MAGYISGANSSSDIFLSEGSGDFSVGSSSGHMPHVPNQIHVVPEKAPLTKLSKGAIIGIVVGSLIGLGLILFLIIYFTVLHTSNNGNAIFGTIQYTDQTTGAAGPVFKPKDVIQVKYLPKKLLASAKLSVSTDNQNFTDLNLDDSTNTASWTIPETVFSDKCLFKVSDGNKPQDFIKTNFFSVVPQILLLNGPGSSKLDSVSVGVNASNQLDFDSVISDLSNPENWRIEFSPTQKFKAVFSGAVVAVSATSVVTWVVSTAPEVSVPYYWRLTTTSLKSDGYPQELSVQSNTPVNIVNTPIPPPGVLAVGVIDSKSGKSGYVAPGDPVNIQVKHSDDITGITFTYFDGTNTISFLPGSPVTVDPNTTDFPWTIPVGLFTDTFYVTITVGSKTAKSANIVIEPEFTWDQPLGGTVVNVYAKNAPNPSMMTTTVNYNGDFSFDNWELGYIDQDGASQPLATVIKGAALVPITWTVSQEQIGLDPNKSGEAVNVVNFVVYVKVSNAAGQSVVLKTSSEVIFAGVWWIPTLAIPQSPVLPNTPYMTTTNFPPQENDNLIFTSSADQGIQCFTVQSGDYPGEFVYTIYIFPQVRQGLEDYSNFLHIRAFQADKTTPIPSVGVAFNGAFDLFFANSSPPLPLIPCAIWPRNYQEAPWYLSPSNQVINAPESATNLQYFDFGAIMKVTAM
jgi:hypothetical protein